MAKKLTSQVLNRMIMEAIEEGGVSGFSYDPSSYERGRGASFSQRAAGLGGVQSDMEQLLNMIQLSDEVPQHIKDFAADVLISPRMPTAKYGSDDVTAKQQTRIPSPYMSEFPTAKMTPDQMFGKSNAPTAILPTTRMPSPQATQGPTKGKFPPAPQMKKPGLFSKLKKAVGLDEQRQIENLVNEVLEELAKKEQTKKADPKKEPKKAGKK